MDVSNDRFIDTRSGLPPPPTLSPAAACSGLDGQGRAVVAALGETGSHAEPPCKKLKPQPRAAIRYKAEAILPWATRAGSDVASSVHCEAKTSKDAGSWKKKKVKITANCVGGAWSAGPPGP